MATTQPAAAYSAAHTIKTTALREIQMLAKSKGVIITIVILTLLSLAGIGFAAWQANKSSADAASTGDGTKVATVGVDTQLLDAAGFEAQSATSRDDAEAMVRDGDVEAAIVAAGDEWEVITDGLWGLDVVDAISEAAQAQTHAEALDNLGISEAQYAAAAPPITVTPVDVDHGDADGEADFLRILTAFIAMMISIFTVITFAAQVGSRVTEEKSSRVVELVLAAVRPMDFLAGKILGNLAFGFIATALILGVNAIGLRFSGLLDGIQVDWSFLPIVLVYWLLAMLFFSALYAAAGAMVQRTEDLQSTQVPILILLLFSAYIPAFGWTNTGASWMQVASWIPPVSIFTAPLTYAAGDFSGAALAGSFTLALAATVVVVWLAARIYRRTILNNGRVSKWSEALRR